MASTDRLRRAVRLGIAIAALALVAGCASTPPEPTVSRVDAMTRALGGVSVAAAADERSARAIDERVAALLAEPLTADRAAQIAVLNQRGMQATLATLGIADADLLEAGRLPNPGLTISRPRGGDAIGVEHSLHYSLARLIVLPLVKGAEEARFEQVQRAVAAEVLSRASEARKAFYRAVAARESERYLARVRDAAQAGAELARRMAEAGNFNRLQQAREQAFYAEATLALARAQQLTIATHERLRRALGIRPEQAALRLPERLPDLPATLPERGDVERIALEQRLDVLSARFGAERMARSLGLTRRTRFINLLDLGVLRNASESISPSNLGYELTIELPLFDWGESRIARAEAYYMQAVHRASEVAINARSEVREAYALWQSSYAIAQHYRDERVPLAKRISEENLLRYNGMFIGVFELLADMRAQIETVNAALAAQRDFWLTEADLDLAMVGRPTLDLPSAVVDGAASSGERGH